MASPYTSVSVTGYNANPPPDDGSQTSANEVSWAKHKTKLTDPLKDAIESVDTNVGSAFDARLLNAVVTASTNTTIATNQRGKLFSCTGTITMTLPAAGTAGSGWEVAIRNDGSGTVTVDGDGSETINGNTTFDLEAGGALLLVSDGSNWSAVAGNDSIAGSAATAAEIGTLSGFTGDTDDLNLLPKITVASGTETISANSTESVGTIGIGANRNVAFAAGVVPSDGSGKDAIWGGRLTFSSSTFNWSVRVVDSIMPDNTSAQLLIENTTGGDLSVDWCLVMFAFG